MTTFDYATISHKQTDARHLFQVLIQLIRVLSIIAMMRLYQLLFIPFVGHYCLEGSIEPTRCDAGYYQDDMV